MDFNISEFIINKEYENKKYILKAIVCRYGINKYFSDVYIKPYFYRFIDWHQGIDVKMINDIKDLLHYEP